VASTSRVLVVGATGLQGGAVVRHLLASGRYEVRCLTRNPQSLASIALAEADAELFQGDLDDVRSIAAALRGCQAVFGVTNYWEHFDREFDQGRNLIDAIHYSEVQHTVLSTAPHAKRLSGGQMEVPACDAKARMQDYARERQLSATYLHVAFYFENFLTCCMPRRRHDGSYVFKFPQGNAPLAAVSVQDFGGVVAAIFAESFWYRDQQLSVIGDERSCAEYASIMSQVLGLKIEYQHVESQYFGSRCSGRGGQDLASLFEFRRMYMPYASSDIEECRELYPEMRGFERWLKTNRTAMERALSQARSKIATLPAHLVI
jgi:uncharacterized protein YbjT (DUF2867 family)